ncbi:3-ketoacyl-ACP reductase [Brevibacillus reuszeri]|uniref:3-ketoacyl-ACP reductase n=1 Tax=Brevibacillus reuszeri TaxID=54915 RepID=A0A0K9YWZ2_9BACL|nr:SDR family oxidoreductase [Brevibacillus reuszeri]KNB73191.1 3-ketoacyl-ACP reductase [Brevibacillus reuszeri]GED68460.1 3-ketoacyl-ACP reductase [Brevibacillus reuszeri]
MLSRKVALITGGATGIGNRIVREMAKHQYDLVINYRSNEKEAKAVATYVEEHYHVKTLCIKGDVASIDDVNELVDHALEQFSTIDVLINNAGPFVFDYKNLVDYDLDEWKYMVDGNLSSVFYLAKRIVPLMRQKKWGRIINFGYHLAETAPGWSQRAAYAAAKTGLVSLTKSLAIEEAPHGITVNMVNLGDIVHPWKEASIADVAGLDNNNTPIGRLGTGEDIARVVEFLTQEKSDFITGAVIPVTGGKTSFI